MNTLRRAGLALVLVLLSCAIYCAPARCGELVPTRLERVILIWEGRYHEVSITVVRGSGQTLFFVDGAQPSPGPGPAPPVPPTPIPPIPFPPTPIPPGKLSTVVIIEESAERTPQTAAMLVDERLLTWRETKKPAWHLIDKDVVDPTGKPPLKFKPYLALVKDKPLPVLILDSDSDGSNGVLYSGSLPQGADKLLTVMEPFE